MGIEAAIIGGTIGSALIGANAAKSSAKTQSRAARDAAELQQQQFERQVELQEPWRQAGITALNKLTPLATEYTPFGMSQFQADPGYAFRLSEGQKALERSAAARGGLMSGGALKATTAYGQQMGSQEYQNAFNRYQAERQARLGPLQSLAGVGQTSANVLGQAGQQMASNVGEMMTSGAAARASGYMGGANALSSALAQGMNMYQGQQRNALMGQMIANQYPGMTYTPGSGGYNYLYSNPASVGPQMPTGI